MCTGSIRIDDEVMELVKPHFAGDQELWRWIEQVVNQAVRDYVWQHQSATNDLGGENVYRQLKSLENDPKGFFKLSSILKPSPYSAEELRDEYVSEKYGL